MDRLQSLLKGHGVLRGIALFVLFSALIALVGWALGVYDDDRPVKDEYGNVIEYPNPDGPTWNR